MIQNKKILIWLVVSFIPATIHSYTITNIDNKNTIHVYQNRKLWKRGKSPIVILEPGQSVQEIPDWANPDPARHHAGLLYSGYGTNRVDFWLQEDDKKSALNSLDISDFRTEDGERILLHSGTTVSIYFDPITDKVEYQLVWKQGGKEEHRTSQGFGTMQKLQALAQQSPGTPQDFPEYGFMMPSQSGLRGIITQYIGKPEPEQKIEAQKPQAPKKGVSAPQPVEEEAPPFPLPPIKEKCVVQ